MKKKTPWWHTTLLVIGIGGMINSIGNTELPGRLALIISLALIIIFGIILPIKR